MIGTKVLSREQFRWLSRDVIEGKAPYDASVSDKVNNFSATGEAVGGVVSGKNPFSVLFLINLP